MAILDRKLTLGQVFKNPTFTQRVDVERRMFEVAEQVGVDKRVGEAGYQRVLNLDVDSDQVVFHAYLLGGRRRGWPPG